MKPVRDWDEEYVINRIPPGEHDWVEFKGRRGLDLTLSNVKESDVLKELAVQLSAFANTGGGTIVYGISDAQAGQAREVDNGGVALNIKGGTKEWLEDVIPTRLEYELTDFNVYVITENHGGQTVDDGRGIFLIQVGDSEAAPHQSRSDMKYYARVGGKSRPIGHRMVMDIAGRRKEADITISHKLVVGMKESHAAGMNVQIVAQLSVENVGRVSARFPYVELMASDTHWLNGFQRTPATSSLFALPTTNSIDGEISVCFAGGADTVLHPGAKRLFTQAGRFIPPGTNAVDDVTIEWRATAMGGKNNTGKLLVKGADMVALAAEHWHQT